VLLITVSIIILEMSLKGFGLHYWNVPATNAVELLKLFYVCQMLYVAVQVFSKVAILSLYSRLFPDFIKWFRWSVRGMVAFMVNTNDDFKSTSELKANSSSSSWSFSVFPSAPSGIRPLPMQSVCLFLPSLASLARV
jgi:hypothetical protein